MAGWYYSRVCEFANNSNAGASPSPPPGVGLVQAHEILAKIPDEGIVIGDLIKHFSSRVGDKPGQMPKQQWIQLVREVCDYGSDKRLRRRK